MTKTQTKITTFKNIRKKLKEDNELKLYMTSRGGDDAFIFETKRYVGVADGDFKTYFFKENNLIKTIASYTIKTNITEEGKSKEERNVYFTVYRKKNPDQELWFPEIYDAELRETRNN